MLTAMDDALTHTRISQSNGCQRGIYKLRAGPEQRRDFQLVTNSDQCPVKLFILGKTKV